LAFYYREREEDIERKEYLLRRELRALSAISGNKLIAKLVKYRTHNSDPQKLKYVS